MTGRRQWPLEGHSARWALVLALSSLLSLTGCVSTALDHGAYQKNAERALGSCLTAARTAQLTIEQYLGGGATRAYANTVLTQSEDAIGPVQASFGTVQPPSTREDQLRTDVLSLLSDTGDTLSDARIAIRRDDKDGLRTAVRSLTELSDKLDKAQQGLQ